jgi:hypothetical protein
MRLPQWTGSTSVSNAPKLCECGCGKPAPIAKETSKRNGHVKGEPNRFIRGHQGRIHLEPPNPSGLCQCGCGQATPIATQTHQGHGHAKGQPLKYIRGHNTRGREMKTKRWVEEDRGYKTPCHIWQLSTYGSGYGKVKVGGRNRHAHRVLFEAAFGPVDRSLEIDHMCRQRDCVRLDHLRVATRSQNAQNIPARPNGTSRYRGVHWNTSRRCWMARVTKGGKSIYLGSFDDEHEAGLVAKTARLRLLPFALD